MQAMEDDSSQSPFMKSSQAASDENCSDNDQNGDNEEHQPGLCGLGVCHPKVMQTYKTMRCFAGIYCFSGMMTSAITMYINSQVTALERQFNMSSSMSGLIMSCNDFGFLLATLGLSYLARRLHIPKALGISTFLYGISAFVCTIAFFGTRDQLPSPPSVHEESADLEQKKVPSQMCVIANPFWNVSTSNNDGDNKSVTSSGEENYVTNDWRTAALMIIGVGMIFQGVAKSPRYAYVSTYVDDNVPKSRSSIYLGIMFGMSFLGPALAFTLGGVFSQMYVTLEETSMSRRDPRWIGAWWLGFLVFGIFSMLAAVPVLFFPKHMYRKSAVDATKRKKSERSERKTKTTQNIKGFLKAMLRLATNPVFVLGNLGYSVGQMSVGGMGAFTAKYAEVHYVIPAWKANILLGTATVLPASFAAILGGWLIARLKLGPRACVRLVIVAQVIAILAQFFSIFVRCEQPTIRTGTDSAENQDHLCVSDCQCNDIDFFPTCGADGRTYFSPCHADCGNYIGLGGFINCTCLAKDETTAVPGLCDPGCGQSLVIYAILCMVFALSASLTGMPTFIILVRSVKDEDKHLALGAIACGSTLLGWFPAPVVFGLVVDMTCSLWKEFSCQEKGACLLYDTEAFRQYFHGLLVGLRVFLTLTMVLIYIYDKFSKSFNFEPHVDANEKVSVAGIKETKKNDDELTNGIAIAMTSKGNTRSMI